MCSAVAPILQPTLLSVAVVVIIVHRVVMIAAVVAILIIHLQIDNRPFRVSRFLQGEEDNCVFCYH